MDQLGLDMQSIVHYVDLGGDKNNQIQDEIEFGALLLVAMSRHGYENPDAIVKVNYPFRVYESEEGGVVLDLLELSKTEKKWLLPSDVSPMLEELEKAEDSEDVLSLVDKCKETLNKEPEFGSIWIGGLNELDDLRSYLLNSVEVNGGQGKVLELFKPVLTKKRFASIRENIKSSNTEIVNNILSMDQTIGRIGSIHETIKKDQEKQLALFKKESGKRLVKFTKEKEKSIKDIHKSLKKEIKSINTDIKQRVSQKTKEVDEISEEVIELKKRLESGEKEVKRDLSEHEKMLKNYDKELKALEEERGKSVSEAENNAEVSKKRCEESFQIRSNEETALLGKLVETHEKVIRNLEELEKKISEVKETMVGNKENLTKVLEIKYENCQEICLPFYLFRYDEESFAFYPPIQLSQGKGIGKKLKLFMRSNLEDKIGQFVSPQTNVLNGLLEMVVNSLKDETEVKSQFIKSLQSVNLLESRETLDMMAVGLYRIMEWDWISERDYVNVQKFLVGKLDAINGGKVYQSKEQEAVTLLNASEYMEVAVSE
jgi:hypothetical protein